MGELKLNILGCGSASPTPLRHPSCQIIDYRRRLLMIDCGEGSQTMMRRMSMPFNRLTNIFVSHMHGDHVLGIPGLLSTLDLHGCGGQVTVTLPEGGMKIMSQMIDYFCHDTSLDISLQPVEGNGGILAELPGMTVEAFPLYHRIPCYGYIFRETPKPRHLRGDMMEFLKVPVYQRSAIKEGADYVTPDGQVIPNDRLTTPPDASVSYAYCSDTMFDERVAEAVKGVDVIYHEATYDSALETQARKRGHSSARQAARIAAMAGAKVLIIGHFSQRYTDAEILVNEARAEFPGVIAASEGLQIDLDNILKKK